MQYPDVPPVSKSKVDRAGFVLVDPKSTKTQRDEAIEIVNAWRVCHAYPMTTFANTLRKKTSNYKSAIVAQRLKRMPTIIAKLRRHDGMKLSRMQDIAGVRAILDNVKEVRKLQQDYANAKRLTHIPDQPVDDYISRPKPDGYRGIHMIYKYNNTLDRTGRATQFAGLRVEIQIRTKLQHQWATAVETVGTMRGEALKSMQGDPRWREFFAYISSAFAIAEGTPVLEAHQNMSAQQIFNHVCKLDKELTAVETIRAWSIAVRVIQNNNSGHTIHHYLLIMLDTRKHEVSITGFSQGHAKQASTAYANLEKQNSDNPAIDIVLVSISKVNLLKKAYPNFFLDTEEFLRKVIGIIKTVKSEGV